MQTTAIEGYRLSPQQRRVWQLQQDDFSGAYRVACAVSIAGLLDKRLFKSAVEKVVSRHEILRTNFRSLSGMSMPVQIISDDIAPAVEEHDLIASNAEDRALQIEWMFNESITLPFDLENESPLRLCLIACSPEEHLAIVSMPSLCADAAALENFVSELAEAYAACSRGEELEGEPMQYADLAEWQNELLESEQTAIEREFWQGQKIAGLTDARLPYPDRSPARTRFDPQVYVPGDKPDHYERVAQAAKACKVEPSTFLLACWQLLLFRLTGQSNILIGNCYDGRTYAGLDEALGPFAKYLPTHCLISSDTRFADLLKRVNESAQHLREWQDYFDWESIATPTGDPGQRFLPICFDFQETKARPVAPGIAFSINKIHACLDRFKVKLSCVVSGRGLVTEFHYDRNSFDVDDIQRMAEGYLALVEALTMNAEGMAGEYEIVGDSERERLLAEFNHTKSSFPREKCLHELIEEQVESAPDKIAVIFDHQQLSYAELNARANRLAHHLRGLGVGPEVRVAICLGRSPRVLVALLGILKAGGAYVPLDPSYPVERLAFMLEDSQASVILTEKQSLAGLPSSWALVVCLDSDWDSIEGQSERGPATEASPENLAYVIYTSGSTGQPKGVMVQHRSVVNYLTWVNAALFKGPALTCPLLTSLTFDASLKQLFAPLLRGDSVWAAAHDAAAEQSSLLFAFSERGNVALNCVPSLWRAILASADKSQTACLSASLSALLMGGEQANKELIERTFAAFPNLKIWNLYGPTEAAANASAGLLMPEHDLTIGRAIKNTQIHILDEQFTLLPIWAPGQMTIAGEGLARGYINCPDITAQRFMPNPFSDEPGARLYNSGDLARYRSDGKIEFIGRLDNQVKIRGYRIELGEIELALNQHSAVEQVVVAAREDEPGERRLVAYIVGKEKVSASDLREYLKGKLPEHMLPSAFVHLPHLPLNSNGKLDRKALPAPSAVETQGDEEGPRTAVEEIVAGIFAEVLKVEAVGAEDNFFELGGHSLLATQVVSRVREVLGVEVALRVLFESSTVAGVAEAVEREQRSGHRAEAPPIVAVGRGQELPLSFAQQRLWFIHQMEPNSAAYNIPMAVRLRGRLNLTVLRQSLQEIARRHEVMRTRFQVRDGQPVQVIDEPGCVELPIWDISDIAKEEREPKAREIALHESARGFDLERGPVWRAALLRMSADEYVFLWTIHHVAGDRWSTGVLIREITALYESYRQGGKSTLPELAAQYADFAVWQRQWLQGEVLEQHLSYWRDQLTGAPSLDLSRGRSRPQSTASLEALVSFRLSADVTRELKALSRREGVTLFMSLVAAYQMVLSRYSGQQDVVVGTDVANRNRLETESLIGFFINQLVLRIKLGDDLTFKELLRRVREVTLGAYAYQDLPFEKLVEVLAPARDLSRTPLFSAKLILQNVSKERVDLPGLRLEPFPGSPQGAKFSLTLRVSEGDAELRGTLGYDPDVIYPTDAELLVAELQELLGLVITQSNSSLASLAAKLDDTVASYREDRDLSLERAFETSLSQKLRPRPIAAR